MKAFQLPLKTQAKLVKATPHKEFDGKNPLKQAISLKLRAKLSLAHLRQINERLPAVFVRRRDDADAQKPVDGVPPIVLEAMVAELVLPVGISAEYSGYTVLIDRAMGDLELYGCTVSKLKVNEVILEGEEGIGEIEWSVGSDEKITPELVGLLCSMEGEDVWLGQKAPDKPVEEAAAKTARKKKADLEAAGQQRLTEATGAQIDGSTGHPGAAAAERTPEQALAESVAGSGGAGPEDDDSEGGAPDVGGADPDGEAEQREIEAGMAAAITKAGVKPGRGKRAGARA